MAVLCKTEQLNNLEAGLLRAQTSPRGVDSSQAPKRYQRQYRLKAVSQRNLSDLKEARVKR